MNKALLHIFVEDEKLIIEINAKEIIPEDDMEAYVIVGDGVLGTLKCRGIIKLNFKTTHKGTFIDMSDSSVPNAGIKLIP